MTEESQYSIDALLMIVRRMWPVYTERERGRVQGFIEGYQANGVPDRPKVGRPRGSRSKPKDQQQLPGVGQ